MNGWKFFPQPGSVRQAFALILSFTLGFAGTLQDRPKPVAVPAPRNIPVPQCLKAGPWAQSMGGGCLSFSTIQNLMQQDPDSDLIICKNHEEQI